MFATGALAINDRYQDKRIKFRKDWTEYSKAREKDLPKTQERILKRIMEKAASENAYLDLYCASDEFVDMAWSDHAGRNERLDYVYGVIDGMASVQGNMLMRLLLMPRASSRGGDSLIAGLSRYKEELSGAHYVTKDMACVVFPDTGDYWHVDDYEFFLSACLDLCETYGDEPPMELVDEWIDYCSRAGDEYMINLVYAKMMKARREISYADIDSTKAGRIRRYQKIAEECGDNAAAFIPLARIAHALVYIYPETEQECIRANGFMSEVVRRADEKLLDAALTERERKLLEDVIDNLTLAMERFKEVSLSDLTSYLPYPCETDIVLSLKNCSDIHVKVETVDSEVIMEKDIHCPGQRSFGVPDTVSLFTLPQLKDGDYHIRYSLAGGKSDDRIGDYRYLDVSSYAVSMRYGADQSPEFYLTDARTGKPVRQSGFTVEFVDREDREPFSGVMDFDGFTPLPVELDSYAVLRFVTPDGRRSPEILAYPVSPYYHGRSSAGGSYGQFFLDRKLFRPGETVYFKYVAYSSDGKGIGPETGKQVSVGLYGADGRKLDSVTGTTNDFGSFSGQFDIPEGLMNGMFSLRAEKGTTAHFRVEDAEPPTFTAVFDPVEGVFGYDDSLVVTGCVRSYRGYGADGVRIAYTVEDGWNRRGFSAQTFTDADGTFSIPLVMTSGYMIVNAVATMPDGSSIEFGKSLMTDGYGAALSLETEELTVSGDGGFYFVGDDTLSFDVKAKNMDGTALDSLVCGYSVYRKDSQDSVRLVSEGRALTGGKLAISAAGLPAGQYVLEVSLEVRGRTRDVSREFVLLDDADNQAYPDMGRPYVFVPDASGAYFMGGRDSLWVLAEYFDANTGELLEVRHDAFAPGVRHIVDSIGAFYPGRDMVRSLYVIKEGDSKVLRTDIFESRDYSLDMEISSLRKVTSSGTEEHFTLIFPDMPQAEVLVDIFDKGTEDIFPNVYGFCPQNVLRTAHIPYPTVCFGGSAYRYLRVNPLMKSSALSVPDSAPSMGREVAEVYDESAVGNAADELAGFIPEDVLRKDFVSTLAFYPHLVPDEDGRLEVDYTTSARLSTFIVQVLAYDKSLRSIVARDEVVVKRDMMVSASVPDFLREGDCATLALTVRNDMELPAFGRFVVEMYDVSYGNPLSEPAYRWQSGPVLVESGRTASMDAALPEIDGSVSEYVLRFAFVGENGTKVSDAEEHTVVVVPSDMTAVNSVSAISDGQGNVSLDVRGLAGNGSDSAVYRIDVSTPVSAAVDAIPLAIEPLSNSLTDWVNALVTMKMAERMLAERPGMADYIRSLEPEDASKYENTPWYGYMSARNRNLSLLDSLLSPSWRRSFEEEAVGKIGEYRYPDGAFSWFPGGRHSVYMTLAFLERYAVAEDFGIGHSGKEAGYISGAIDYLDKEFSSHLENMSDSLGWRRYRKLRFDSDAFVHDYMFVRSFYINSVALSGDAARFYRKCEKLMAKRATFADVPLKIKYARVLLNGDRYASSRRIADIVASLYEYAQEDRWGNLCFGAGIHGLYGIFDSEIYVNSSALMLFDHLDKAGFEDRKGTAGKVSVLLSGIERHLLSLKESSDWGDGFRASVAVAALISRSSGDFPAKACHIVTDADGLASMTDGGFLEIPASEGRDLKIVSVSKVYHTRIEDLEASSNGLSVSRSFYRRPLASQSLEPLADGDMLEPGDVVVCKYSIDNDESRSFVRLRAMRPACFTVSDIRSGYAYSWRTSFSAYRDIRESHTDYYADYLPEGVSEITEEFFVSVAGTFSAGNLEAVSVYAPQYRGHSAVQQMEVM